MTDIILLIIFLIVAACVLVGIGFIVRGIWKTGTIGKIAIAALCLFLAWDTYQYKFPPNSFYAKEFKRLVNIEIPNDAEFISKYASDSDFFGDYSACFNIQLPQSSYEIFAQQLGTEISKDQFETNITSCENKAISEERSNSMHYFNITKLAKREDALIGVISDSNKKQFIIIWNLW